MRIEAAEGRGGLCSDVACRVAAKKRPVASKNAALRPQKTLRCGLLNEMRCWGSATRWFGIATRHATSLQRPAAAPDHPTRTGRKTPPRRPVRMARGPRAYGGQVGGGIFALRRPRPYSRHCGAYCHRPSYTPHGHQRAWREGEKNDAARRVATPSEKWGNRI